MYVNLISYHFKITKTPKNKQKTDQKNKNTFIGFSSFLKVTSLKVLKKGILEKIMYRHKKV